MKDSNTAMLGEAESERPNRVYLQSREDSTRKEAQDYRLRGKRAEVSVSTSLRRSVTLAHSLTKQTPSSRPHL